MTPALSVTARLPGRAFQRGRLRCQRAHDVELDHCVLEEEAIVHVVAATADVEQAALLPERDGQRRVGVRRPRFAVVVFFARPIADLVGQRLDGEAVRGEVDRGPGLKLAGLGSAVVAPLIASTKVFAKMGDHRQEREGATKQHG